MVISVEPRTRSVAWLTRIPVKNEIAGSNPVGSALTFLNDPELVEGEFRNDNAHKMSLYEPRYER